MTDPVLVERLVRAILAQIGPEEAPCACHSAAGGCCPDRLGRLLAHGAERFGMQAGGNLYSRDIARAIDHTLLKPEATREQIETLCAEAREHNDANVLALGAKFVDSAGMAAIVETFLTARCTEERHARRVEKIKAIEESYLK